LGEIFPFFGKEILARTALVLGAHDSQPWKCITKQVLPGHPLGREYRDGISWNFN